MLYFRILWRAPCVIILISFGVLASYVWLPRNPETLNKPHWWLIRIWHRTLLKIMAVKIDVYTLEQELSRPALLLSNHISWLDIPVISAVQDAAFVAKAEIQQWPLIGRLCTRAGTIFIPRGNTGAAAMTVAQISKRLECQQQVLVFPEGTTTAGASVRTFHSRLLEAATITRCPIQPLAIKYIDCPEAAFVGDDALGANILGLLGRRQTRVELHHLPRLESSKQARKTLAKQSQQAVANCLNNAQQTQPEIPQT